MHAATTPLARRPRSLAHELVAALGERIRSGQWPAGTKLPTEAAVMAEFSVSRTVVREALSQLQAAGLVQTRHGIGTFVAEPGETGANFHIGAADLETLHDVIAVLELRIGVETEAAGLAALRRSPQNLLAMREALDAFAGALQQGRDAVAADQRFHQEIAHATQNPHFVQLMVSLGGLIIPRARLGTGADERAAPGTRRRAQGLPYLRGVHAEHETIYDAIVRRDAAGASAAMRTHLVNSRERRRRAASRVGATPLA